MTRVSVIKKLVIPPLAGLTMIGGTLAHCPLCTIGAGVLAVGAAQFGISIPVIALFLGAFAAAMGAWIARLLSWKFPHKETVFVLVSYLTTMIPIKPLIGDYYTSLPVYLAGEYGSFLNKTYLIDVYYVMSVLGAVIILLAPHISKHVTKLAKREHPLPYQGIVLTFLLLVSIGIMTQVLQ